jgi:APA family basic amino acid/polyamine antiporter
MIPTVGFIGCLLLAALLPISSVLIGAGVVAIGVLAYCLR